MKRILITRAPHQASVLADALRACGFEPIPIPTIELAPPTTFAPLDAGISAILGPNDNQDAEVSGTATDQVPQGFSLGSHSQIKGDGALAPAFHWLLFTSANAVEAFANRLEEFVILSNAKDLLLESGVNIVAIGPATASAVEQLLGTKPDLIPDKAVAESLAEAILPHTKQLDGTPTRFLLIRAEHARDILPETLQRAGGEVTIAPAYRTVIPQDSIPLIRTLFHSPETYPDAITFTSSSTVTNLLALLEAADLSLPPHIPRISIGPITSQTLRDFKLPPHAEARESTISSLMTSLLESIR